NPPPLEKKPDESGILNKTCPVNTTENEVVSCTPVPPRAVLFGGSFMQLAQPLLALFHPEEGVVNSTGNVTKTVTIVPAKVNGTVNATGNVTKTVTTASAKVNGTANATGNVTKTAS